jgi:PT repeat
MISTTTTMRPFRSLFLLLLSCCVVHRQRGWCHAGPTAEPTKQPTKSPTDLPTRFPTAVPSSAPSDACNVDATPPDLTCPTTTVTLLGLATSAVALPGLVSRADTDDACGISSFTQVPTAGTMMAVNTTTLVNVTSVDFKGNTNECTIRVQVIPSTLLYQTTFLIQGKRSEAQQRSFVVPTNATLPGEGVIHAITGTLNKNLYYYSEVVRGVLVQKGANATEPDVAVTPRLLIQWRRKEAVYAFDDEAQFVPFANDTTFTLDMSSNDIEAPYTVTYRVYGQRTS